MDPFQVFDSIFGNGDGIFGGQGIGSNFDKRGSRQNLDIWFNLSLTFEESVFGVKRDITVPCLETCDDCSGTGAKSMNSIKSCSECGGKGRIMRSQRTPFGVVSQVSTCMKCGGDGKMVIDNCPKCDGHGMKRSKRYMEVVIPAGVDNGATMQLQGEGNFDKNRGIAGDLYVVLHIEEKQGIWREGLDLYSRVSIDYADAILGTVVEVDTVEGSKKLHIPSGIQPGGTVKLSRMGVPKAHKSSRRGDHVFIVDVQIPKTVSGRERELVEELASLRASSEYSTSADDKRNMSTQPGQKCKSNIFNAVKQFLRGRQKRQGFASTTIDLRPALWRCSKLNPVLPSSWFQVFLVTVIIALISKINCNSSSKTNLASHFHSCKRVTGKD